MATVVLSVSAWPVPIAKARAGHKAPAASCELGARFSQASAVVTIWAGGLPMQAGRRLPEATTRIT